MTPANQITIVRLLLVPVFAVFAARYGLGVEAGRPNESLRWAALGVFVLASATDGLDGWIARRFDQKSRLGAILDPLADKALLLTALITLSAVPWGADDWRIPLWFAVLVIIRDIIILGGMSLIHLVHGHFHIRTHWTGKVCTVTQMIALGWVMLKIVPFDPLWPCLLAAVFTVISGAVYLREGIGQLRHGTRPDPGGSSPG